MGGTYPQDRSAKARGVKQEMRLQKKIIIIASRLSVLAGLLIPSYTFADDYAKWAKTGLDFKILRQNLKDENCLVDEVHLKGCVAAINSLIEEIVPQEETHYLIPASDKKLTQYIFKVQQTFDLFEIAQMRPLKVGTISDVQTAVLERRNAILKAISDLYRHKNENKISLSFILDHFEKLLEPEKIALAVKRALEAYGTVTLSPYYYLSLENSENDEEQPSNIGVGVYHQQIGDYAFVRVFTPESLAAARGLHINDRIVKVENKQINLKDIKTSLHSILNQSGTLGNEIDITVERDGSEIKVRVPQVKLSTKSTVEFVNNVAIIRLKNFSEGSCEQVKTMLSEKATDGVVLDLRNNHGGNAKESLCIASLFLDEGISPSFDVPLIMGQPLFERRKPSPTTKARGQYFNLPLVIIQNFNSISAAEDLAMMVEDHQLGLVVGERSWGKGISGQKFAFNPGRIDGVQENLMMDLFSGPRGSPHNKGVRPDIFAYQSPNPSLIEMVALRHEDIYAHRFQISNGERSEAVEAKKIWIIDIRSCVDKTAPSKYGKSRDDPMSWDYQRLAALETINCMRQIPYEYRKYQNKVDEIDRWRRSNPPGSIAPNG